MDPGPHEGIKENSIVLLSSKSLRLHKIPVDLGSRGSLGRCSPSFWKAVFVPFTVVLPVKLDACALLPAFFWGTYTKPLSLCSELPHKQPSETESLCQQERGGKHYFLYFAPGDPKLKAWQSIPDLLREALPGWKRRDGTVQRRLRVLFHVSSFIHSLSVDKLNALNLGWGCLHTTAVAYQTWQYNFLIIVNFSVTSGYVVLWIGNNLILGRPC